MGASLPPPPVCAAFLIAMFIMVYKIKGERGDWLRLKILVLWIVVTVSSCVLFVWLVVYGGGSTILKTGLHCKIGGYMAWVKSDWVHWACNKGCVGQTLSKSETGAGFCNDEKACSCSELPIDLRALSDQVATSCLLGEEDCFKSCQAIGRRTGHCSKNQKFQWLCECSEETLTKKELELCKTEAACDAFCQALAGVSGECQGWGCQCRMSDRVVLENVLIKQVEARKASNPPQANTANVRPKPSLIVELPPDLQPPDL